MILSRSDAVTLGLQRYFTGAACKHGHVADRFTSCSKCCACAPREAASWRANNEDKARDSVARWQKANRAKARAACASWRGANPNKSKSADARWKKANPDKNTAKENRRRARKLRQSPPLNAVEKMAVEFAYAEARSLTALTGEVHHVDHKTPLSRGGLHHPDNLHILTAVKNLSKGAKTLEEFLAA